MANRHIAIFITCNSRDEAGKIAVHLLRKRLVACANIISGVESRFWWRGKINRAKEVLVILKAVQYNFKNIEREVKRLHSYEVPEIIAFPIVAGSKDYLKWISDV